MKRMWSKNELKQVIQNQASSGDLKDIKVFEEIVDKDGHKRFIEGDIDNVLAEGITRLYGKWSLSGSHLLIVECLSLADETIVADNTLFAKVEIPAWVYDKIVPIVGTVVEYKNSNAYASDYSSQNLGHRLHKQSNVLNIYKDGAVTMTKDRVMRISYDLLIDND